MPLSMVRVNIYNFYEVWADGSRTVSINVQGHHRIIKNDIRCYFQHCRHIQSVRLICGKKTNIATLCLVFVYNTFVMEGKGGSSQLHQFAHSYIQHTATRRRSLWQFLCFKKHCNSKMTSLNPSSSFCRLHVLNPPMDHRTVNLLLTALLHITSNTDVICICYILTT